MKKVMMSLAAVAIMSVSAFGATVGKININANGTIQVQLDTKMKSLVGTTEAIKAMYAAALTAKSTTTQVNSKAGTYNDDYGWIVIEIQ